MFGLGSRLDARLSFRPIYGSNSLTKRITLGNVTLGCLDRLDTTPLLPALGFNLAHFFAGMVPCTVVAENRFRSRHELTKWQMASEIERG